MSPKSFQDWLLQPLFAVGTFVLSFTIVRLWTIFFILLPVYIPVILLSILRHVIQTAPLLLHQDGRRRLVQISDDYRQTEAHQAKQQLDGTYKFPRHSLFTSQRQAIQKEARWFPNTEVFDVSGARVNVVHEKPEHGVRKGNTLILLHGNPSWSYMWRNVIPSLTSAGYEVYALDWLGHGLSDKPLDSKNISFELHMATLLTLIYHFHIRDFSIIAHDWGGCIATACGPYFPPSINHRIFLLNSFLPPRPFDISLNCYALYVLWFLSTGLLDGLIPEWAIMRYMASSITSEVTTGYSAPYTQGGIKSKASITRFSHMIPGLSNLFLFNVRDMPYWRLLEGLCGPADFSNLNAQARLASLDSAVRRFWVICSRRKWSVGIVFGEDDPLLRDFKCVLEDVVDPQAQVPLTRAGWIEGAGHYPMEEKPKEVSKLILEFLEKTTMEKEEREKKKQSPMQTYTSVAKKHLDVEEGHEEEEEEEVEEGEETGSTQTYATVAKKHMDLDEGNWLSGRAKDTVHG